MLNVATIIQNTTVVREHYKQMLPRCMIFNSGMQSNYHTEMRNGKCSGTYDAQAQAERQRAHERQQALALAASRGGLLHRVVQQAWLRGSYLLTDHTRNALILSVFAFKATASPASHCS